MGTPGTEEGSVRPKTGHQGVSAFGLVLAGKAGCGAGNWAGQPPSGDEWEGAADPGTHPVYLAHRGTCVSSEPPETTETAARPTHPPVSPGPGLTGREGGVSMSPPTPPLPGPSVSSMALSHPSSEYRAQASSPSHPCPAPSRFSAPRAPGPPTCLRPCITGTHRQVRRGRFPSAFLNVSQSVSLHPNTRTPTCNIQQLSPRQHNPCLSRVPPTSLLFSL